MTTNNRSGVIEDMRAECSTSPIVPCHICNAPVFLYQSGNVVPHRDASRKACSANGTRWTEPAADPQIDYLAWISQALEVVQLYRNDYAPHDVADGLLEKYRQWDVPEKYRLSDVPKPQGHVHKFVDGFCSCGEAGRPIGPRYPNNVHFGHPEDLSNKTHPCERDGFREWWNPFSKSDEAKILLGLGSHVAPFGSNNHFILRRCATLTWNACKAHYERKVQR